MHLHKHVKATRAKGAQREWAVLSCPRCGGAILLEAATEGQGNAILQVVPEPGAESNVEHLPDDVHGYYRAAITVLEAGVPDAAAVQLRRTLEAAAAHRGVRSGPLVGRIENLIEIGAVTAEFGKVLDHIRQLGNIGAHAGDEYVDEEAARRALRFTTQVLRNLFEIPAELGITNPGDSLRSDS
jgi:hypothetical protein